ncbi:MAG: FecCD family ABC transporter permease [Christensenellales bacterium]|jgi:iron complex transport system permease protein|nr:iron ABC transporter permease [Christensenellaceae bacterium]
MDKLKNHGKRERLTIAAMAVMLLGGVLLSFALGRYPISPRETIGIMLSKIIHIEPFWTERMATVLFNVRLPRILLACLVGCCLSSAGAAYQGIFQNPMAAPDILGASAGAAFGAALAILSGASSRLVSLSAFFFSLLTVALVWLLSRRTRGKQIIGLVLAGIMISSLFSAGTSFIKLVADPTNQLPAITYWLMGSLSGAKMSDISFAVFPMLVGMLPLFLLRWRINILSLGDDEARTMGVNVRRLRLVVIVSATLVTSSAVAVSGTIGWVGLVIPHLSRKLVGSNFRHLMPATMLFGALFLLLVDNISRNLFAVEIPIGILTAFIGAPFFLSLIIRGTDRS